MGHTLNLGTLGLRGRDLKQIWGVWEVLPVEVMFVLTKKVGKERASHIKYQHVRKCNDMRWRIRWPGQNRNGKGWRGSCRDQIRTP